MNDLIERLRRNYGSSETTELRKEAADALEAMQAVVDAARDTRQPPYNSSKIYKLDNALAKLKNY